jgi:hypothetical protein
MTTAPGRTWAAPIIFGRPIAATTMSASCAIDGRSTVREWHVVTVAFSASSSSEAGLPTTGLRPITQARAPDSGTPPRVRISTTAAAVAGAKLGRPSASRPRLSGFMPSTSLPVGMRAPTSAARTPAGSGVCTNTPCTVGSAASRSRVSPSSAASPVSSCTTHRTPTLPAVRSIIRTYDSAAGSLVGTTTANVGVTDCRRRRSASSMTPRPMSAAIDRPSSSLMR